MPNHAYRAASAPSVVQRARNTRTGRKLERGGYLTVETVTMWIVYALTLIGNAVIEGGRVGGTTSADIAYGVFTWFTPAGSCSPSGRSSTWRWSCGSSRTRARRLSAPTASP